MNTLILIKLIWSHFSNCSSYFELCFSLPLAGLSHLLMWIFFAAYFTNSRRNRWERASGIWLTAPLTQPEEGCCERLACFSDAIGCSLESRVCSHINDCWGDGGASMWSAWHLIEGRDAPLTAAVKTGREGHWEHMKAVSMLSSACFWTSSSCFTLTQKQCVLRWKQEQNWFLINCVKIRWPHIVDGLYVARWGFLVIWSAAHLMEI